MRKRRQMIELHPQVIEKDGEKAFAVLPYDEFVRVQRSLRATKTSGNFVRRRSRTRTPLLLLSLNSRRNWGRSSEPAL